MSEKISVLCGNPTCSCLFEAVRGESEELDVQCPRCLFELRVFFYERA